MNTEITNNTNSIKLTIDASSNYQDAYVTKNGIQIASIQLMKEEKRIQIGGAELDETQTFALVNFIKSL